jgi:hypothetical protein
MVATRVTWLPLAVAMLVPSASASADNWPQWRGPAGTGASGETRLPASWSQPLGRPVKVRLKPDTTRTHDGPAEAGHYKDHERLGGVMRSQPSMSGRSASGMTTDPSFC